MAYPTDLDSFTTKTTGQTIDASHINALQSVIAILENRVGITGDEPIIATTKMLVYADTAPANWTIDDTLNDALVFITDSKVGSQTGGIPHSTGSWTVSGLTNNNESSHTHQVAAHSHTGATGYATLTGSPGENYFETYSITGANYHYHTISSQAAASSGAGTSHTHTVSSAGTWRPAAYNFILCTKDSYPTT